MSLRLQDPPTVSEETRRVARATFPKGTLCMRIADALGLVYQDRQVFSTAPQQPAEVTTASDVAEAVWRAVTDPASPLRIPAGADAVALAAQTA